MSRLIIWGRSISHTSWDEHWKTHLVHKMSHFVLFLSESAARVVKGKTGLNVGAPRGDPVQHPLPYRAMQRRPAGQSGRRLQAGRESSRTASVHRTRAGRQHNAVSGERCYRALPEHERASSAFLSSSFAVNDAERTACPSRDRPKRPKANTGPATRRGRGKGSVFYRYAFAQTQRPRTVVILNWSLGFQVYLHFRCGLD